MNSALAQVHLGMVQRFPTLLSWVPSRRRSQVSAPAEGTPHTCVLARDEAGFWAWLGQNVPAGERRGYAFLAEPAQVVDFRGRVLVLPGSGRRADVAEMVEAVEARVQCGAVRWDA